MDFTTILELLFLFGSPLYLAFWNMRHPERLFLCLLLFCILIYVEFNIIEDLSAKWDKYKNKQVTEEIVSKSKFLIHGKDEAGAR